MLLTIRVDIRNTQTIADTMGVMYEAFPSYVWDRATFVFLQDYVPSKEITKVRIGLMQKWWHVFFPRWVTIPPNLHQAILRTLRDYHAKQDMDFSCFSFASLAGGNEVFIQKWRHEPLENPEPGDVIFLTDPSNTGFHHAAVYLGENLYVSVYGVGGDIEITTLEDMQHCYDKATHILKATPVRP